MADYHLQRNYRANSRLTAQHLIFCRTLPYIVHPAVTLPATAHIADVGTGNGAWLLDLARKLPETTTLHGLDVSLTQCPHPTWCPPNVSMRMWDVYQPVPADLRRMYDLVHVRFFILVVRDQDPRRLVEQLKLLTKPGGYIQWSECDMWKFHVTKASDEIESSSTEAVLRRLKSATTARAGEPPGWAAKLPDMFRSCGLEDVKVDYFKHRNEDLANFHDNVLLGAEEMSNFVHDGEEFRELIHRASVESDKIKRGVAITSGYWTVVGRVPS